MTRLLPFAVMVDGLHLCARRIDVQLETGQRTDSQLRGRLVVEIVDGGAKLDFFIDDVFVVVDRHGEQPHAPDVEAVVFHREAVWKLHVLEALRNRQE